MNQKMNNIKDIKFVFFGTPDIAVTSLNELKSANLIPSIIVTSPDKPAGRGMKMQSSPVKEWAEENNIKILQPDKLDKQFITELKTEKYDAFVIVAYGKMIPQTIIDIPKHGTLNMHPSLLPKHRGPSPIESQILNLDEEVGATIMLIDKKMDHGPILTQTKVDLNEWPIKASSLTKTLGDSGAKLLAETLPKWVHGEIKATAQDDDQATYCHMIKKEDALIELSDDPHINYLKFLAYEHWPRVFFFTDDNKRTIITDASFENDKFVIKRVIPEGKKEVEY